MTRILLFLALLAPAIWGEDFAAPDPTNPPAGSETPETTPTPETAEATTTPEAKATPTEKPTATPRPHHAQSLGEILLHYEHLDASRSLVDLFHLLPKLRGVEHAVGRFLIANALAELGFYEPSILELQKLELLDSLTPAASVALCRILSDSGDDAALFQAAMRVDWTRLQGDDRSEVAYRAARAAFRLRRYGQVLLWLENVPSDASFGPFATYLLAQTQTATGQYSEAVKTAERILRERAHSQVNRHLQDRTAIFLGDLFTEMGLYSEAAEILRWSPPESPFTARAKRDQIVASGLLSLALGKFDDARPLIDRLHAYLQKLAGEVEQSVATEDLVAERAAELRRVWPPKFLVYARREWAAHRAFEILASLEETKQSDPFQMLWDRLKAPVTLPWLGSHNDRPSPWLPGRDVKHRFFFPPPALLSNLLVGLALLEDRPSAYGDDCGTAAAMAIRRRIADSLLGESPAPTESDLRSLAGTCASSPSNDDLVARGTVRLHEAIREDATRVQEQFRREELEVERAIATAYLKQTRAIESAQKNKKLSRPRPR